MEAGGFDFVGFALVATFLGSLEVILDRGLEDDWFGSSFIVVVATICALAFVAMIPWELSRRNPTIDIRMVAGRQFAACFVVMLATGAILMATTQYMPQLVQQDFGYTATWAGLALTPGGLVTMGDDVRRRRAVEQGATEISHRRGGDRRRAVDVSIDRRQRRPRLLVLRPFAHAARRRPAADLPAEHDGVVRRRSVRQDRPGVGPAQRGAQHRRLARRPLIANVLTDRGQFHQSRLIEHAIPSSVPYQQTLQQATRYFVAHGSSLAQAQQQAIGWIGQQLQAQTSLLSYVDAFWVLTLLSLAAVPLALTLRKVKLGGASASMH